MIHFSNFNISNIFHKNLGNKSLFICQFPANDIEGAAGGQQVKDSSSQGSNADSGRGSHEDTSSLPGNLQRWDNVPLALSKFFPPFH